jgi:glycogen debranching enzyme
MKTAGDVAHAPAPAGPGAPADQFFIPAATSLQERRTRTLKHGDSFGVFDPNGDSVAGPGSPEGLYHRDTRHLSHFLITIDGQRPMLLSSTLRDDNAMLTCDLTNPDLYDATGGLALEHDLVHLRRMRFLWQAACHERLAVRHFGSAPQRLRLGLSFAADFADLFEVRGTRRERHGLRHAGTVSGDTVTLGYTGLDGLTRRTVLSFATTPAKLSIDGAVFDFVLQPGETRYIDLTIDCAAEENAPDQARPGFMQALRRARRTLRTSAARAAAITSSSTTFNEAIRRSVSDLYMLITDTPDGPYPYAGIPWFSTVFGRDALITAMQTLWLDPAIARGVLCHLARHQAETTDEAADAEPGKILHEMRQGEMALLGEVPFRHYYGSIDSTPLFVMLAGAYLERTDDLKTVRRLWPNIQAALGWMDQSGDRDGDGFIEYGRRRDTGLINQGWKDSHDSIFHADGTLAHGPVALVEVQAYAFGAWRAAASIARRLGEDDAADGYADRASRLQQRFDEAFFDKALGTYVLALDGDKKPCRVRASNAGHALFSGIARPERAPAVVKTLTSSAFFSGWGVRTLAVGEARYNPMSYHNGSVWPHDNALIAAGFARYGFRREAARLFDGLFAAAAYIDLRRLPELFCGFPRERGHGPTFYPVACSPQAWAAATPLSMLQSCLGLRFDTARGSVAFDEPLLPDFLNDVTLQRLSLGDAAVDVALHRRGKDLSIEVLGRRGRLGVDLS